MDFMGCPVIFDSWRIMRSIRFKTLWWWIWVCHEIYILRTRMIDVWKQYMKMGENFELHSNSIYRFLLKIWVWEKIYDYCWLIYQFLSLILFVSLCECVGKIFRNIFTYITHPRKKNVNHRSQLVSKVNIRQYRNLYIFIVGKFCCW